MTSNFRTHLSLTSKSKWLNRSAAAIFACTMSTAAFADDRAIFDIVVANEDDQVSSLIKSDIARQIAGPDASSEFEIRDFSFSVDRGDCHAVNPIWPEDPPNVFGLCVVKATGWQIAASYVVLVRFGAADAVSLIEFVLE